MTTKQPYQGFILRSGDRSQEDVGAVLSEADASFLSLAAKGLTGDEGRLPHIDWKDDPSKRQKNFFCNRMSEWPHVGHIETMGVHVYGKSIFIGFALAGLVYGGMHLLAWNAPFRNSGIRGLWRASSLLLACSGPLLALHFVPDGKAVEDSDLYFWMTSVGFALFMVWALLYVVARIFLVVECFVELYRLPEDVFDIPYWLNHWPHIG